MKINIKKFIPQNIDHRDVFIEEVNNKFYIYCNKIRPPRPILLNKYIPINEDIFKIVGLYFGDGNNKNSGSANRRVALANSCPKLQLDWIKFLGEMGVPKERLYAQIQIGDNITEDHNSILNYWSKNINLPTKCFQKKISVKKCKTEPYGLVAVNFHNKLFRRIFENIFSYFFSIVISNKNFISAFLRGLFAAEGYSRSNKNNSLNALDIPIKNYFARKYIESLFSINGIKCVNNNERVYITGYINFTKFREMEIHIMHPDRASRFERLYSNLIKNGKIPSFTKLKIINSLKYKPKTRYELSNELCIKVDTVYKSLKDLEIKGFVKLLSKERFNNYIKGCKWQLNKMPDNPYNLMVSDYN